MHDNEYEKFGFKEVPKGSKQKLVNQVFNSVSSKYDIMNNLMSLGIHRLWKKSMLDMLPNPKGLLLDVAGGTGDIANLFIKKAKSARHAAEIVILDINYEMLNQGIAKSVNNNLFNYSKWICGNAEELPFSDNSFDYYTIAFGIRNVANIDKALQEAYRVLKPGGKFVCLEFSHVENSLISTIYDQYSFNIIPKLGKIIAEDEASYKYLVESIREFPSQEQFLNQIRQAGFKYANYKNLTFGVAALHYGYKITS